MQARIGSPEPERARPGRRFRRAPVEFVTSGKWPYARLAGGTSDSKEDLYAAIYAQALAAALTEQMGQASQRAFAERLQIPTRTLDYLLAGRTIPDLATLAQLEVALGEELLPRDRLRLVPRTSKRE